MKREVLKSMGTTHIPVQRLTALLDTFALKHASRIRNDPAGNIKADKEKSTEKIDGTIAAIISLDRAIRCGNSNSASVYDDRGILFI